MYVFDPKNRFFFGRRRMRAFRGGQREAFDAVMAVRGITPDIVTQSGAVEPHTLFTQKPDSVWFEIGFGDGTFVSEMLPRHPNRAYIVAEPFENGVANLCKKIVDYIDPAIRIWMEDGIPLLRTLADFSLDGIYVLNPDPWPKVRHHKRRLINTETLDLFAQKLKPGGLLTMTSDVVDLADWMRDHALDHPDFTWVEASRTAPHKPPADWVTTKYERKGLEAERPMAYLVFQRNKTLAKASASA
ncbi:MAG: tRNA (guanosine(46)-N7)-methyltransferase TrmB [Pseudomonadota bacterium]